VDQNKLKEFLGNIQACEQSVVWHTDILQYRLRFWFFLLYKSMFESLDSAALLWRESCGWGGQI
jgi:hypothetical protein